MPAKRALRVHSQSATETSLAPDGPAPVATSKAMVRARSDALAKRLPDDLAALLRALAAPEGAGPSGASFARAASMLTSLLDLHGSVDLSRRLASLEALPHPPFDRDAAPRARAVLRRRLREIAAMIEASFAEPFRARNKLPTAADMLSVLADTGALAQRRGRPLALAADALWPPFRELAAGVLARVRAELRELRHELGHHLRAMGPTAARIERLDAALAAATGRGVDRLFGRLLPAAAPSFAQSLALAMIALPSEPAPDPTAIAAWFAEGGWVRRELSILNRVVAGVLRHERDRLEALVEAACAAASD